MSDETTNLLPLERQHALTRDYRLHLWVVGVWLLTALALIASVLLVPTYVFLSKSATAKEAHLATIKSALSASDEAAFSARLSVLSNNTTTLMTLVAAPSVSAIMRTMLAIAHPDVMLSSFIYVPAVGSTPATLSIYGVAATRNALRSYQLALERASFARAVTLPVSAYTQDTNNTFTIMITLAL